jgi:hypothetical protein
MKPTLLRELPIAAFGLFLAFPAVVLAGPIMEKEPVAIGPIAAAATFTPPMFGDLPYIEQDNIQDGTSNTRTVRVFPLVTSYGPLKIAENESPVPRDRVFATYNYYSDVLDTDFHRETFGFEKTFLDGDASFGIRVPVFQFRGDSEIDDFNLITKFVLLRKESGVLTGGLAVSAPVHGYEPVEGGDKEHIPLIQPYVGYLWRKGNFFVHGFTSIAVPTDDVLPTVLFNDIGVGYRFDRDGPCLTAITPTFEVHVNTPLSNRDSGDPERRRDSVDLTAGAHFELWGKHTLGFAVGTTVTNPRLFDVEGLVSLNINF